VQFLLDGLALPALLLEEQCEPLANEVARRSRVVARRPRHGPVRDPLGQISFNVPEPSRELMKLLRAEVREVPDVVSCTGPHVQPPSRGRRR
jgi:hypothetical protein